MESELVGALSPRERERERLFPILFMTTASVKDPLQPLNKLSCKARNSLDCVRGSQRYTAVSDQDHKSMKIAELPTLL